MSPNLQNIKIKHAKTRVLWSFLALYCLPSTVENTGVCLHPHLFPFFFYSVGCLQLEFQYSIYKSCISYPNQEHQCRCQMYFLNNKVIISSRSEEFPVIILIWTMTGQTRGLGSPLSHLTVIRNSCQRQVQEQEKCLEAHCYYGTKCWV